MVEFQTALAAGLSQTEIAKVLGVSRVTLNLWLNGKMKPHRYHKHVVDARIALLNKAVEQNLIPKQDKKRKPRHDAISAVLEQLANPA